MKALAKSEIGNLCQAACGHLRLNLDNVSIQLTRVELLELTGMLLHGMRKLNRSMEDTEAPDDSHSADDSR
ncbi:MAG TPA: hypothetical protein DEA96_00905 [Leptospiraceae bacterium]|nr:hypothetical protein [Spirochaetaceae bacterium]HBS03491.1 hypothetical protein [Leptospiraceae bacterium]|tara:strand:+ start:1860 stop:2072 length:213 start_codon:yes stop_codon:yes gene_type:complete